jgi:hypothetical protein
MKQTQTLTVSGLTVRDIHDVDAGIAFDVEDDGNGNKQTRLVFEQLNTDSKKPEVWVQGADSMGTYALHVHKSLIPPVGGTIHQQTEICMSDVQVQTFILLLANMIDCDVTLVKQTI